MRDRKEFRFGELIEKNIFKNLSFLFQGSLKKFKAIDVKNVAKAMLIISKKKFKDIYYNSNRLQEILNKY